MDGVFVLIHSPLVGPLTWSRVAERLRQGGHPVEVPALTGDDEHAHVAYWQQEVEAIRGHLAATPVPQDLLLILVAHSGAGALLPAVRAAIPHRVGGYIFVDAGLPHPGQTRLEEM